MLKQNALQQQIGVLVVDDSNFMRNAIVRHIERDKRLKVLDTAANGRDAVAKALQFRPDVITMDVEMPEMNGIEALRQILAKTNIPVVMVSAQTEAGAKTTIQCLQLGAVDFIPKAQGFDNLHDKLFAVVNERRASKTKIVQPALKVAPQPAARSARLDARLVVIGSSTGGPRALHKLLSQLPKNFPAPIVVAQHMPTQFTAAMAKWLSETCAINVVEAANDMPLVAGTAYVGPGGMQFRLANGRAKISPPQGESLYKPSVDLLAESAASACGGHVLAIMLTGMGNDGARGFSRLKKDGGYILAQDQISSTVFGMPRAVIESGCADEILGIEEMGKRVNALFGLPAK